MNLLLQNFFSARYPDLEVECGVLKSPIPNAYIFGTRNKGKLFVTTAALEKIHEAGQKIHQAPFFQSGADAGSARTLKVTDESMTALALAALLGHELGHLYDRQFHRRNEAVDKRPQIEVQALEFAADTWGVRAATDLLLGSLKDQLRLDGPSVEDKILTGVTRALIGHGVLDRMDWVQPWVTPEMGWPHNHPPSAMRLFSCAIAISEQLELRGALSEDTAATLCVAAFDTAAKALHWYATGQVREAGYFIKTALERLDGGASIDLWREAYERFQKSLPPKKP